MLLVFLLSGVWGCDDEFIVQLTVWGWGKVERIMRRLGKDADDDGKNHR